MPVYLKIWESTPRDRPPGATFRRLVRSIRPLVRFSPRVAAGLRTLPAMASVVELIAARKRFGDVEAVRGVDLTIEAGEVVALLGPNGAGKTTSISLMLGLRQPSSGEARLFGLTPSDRRARSRCGVMLQEGGVPAVLRGAEIVDLCRSASPPPLPTERVLALAGLADKASSFTSRLSGGERQRLYFALAICGDPEALFLDEPSVGMDVTARRGMVDTIRTFAAAGKTIVLTTHYLDEADQLARRIVVIDHGVVIADAPPPQIKARVASKRVSFSTTPPLTDDLMRELPARLLERNGARVRLLSGEPERLLQLLFEWGVRVRELEVVGADLEEAFISLTRRRGVGR